MHWASSYIGKPFCDDGESAGFNCWTLFAHVQENQYGRECQIPLPAETIEMLENPNQREDFTKDVLFKEEWEQVEELQDGDAVLLGRTHIAYHIGVYLEVDGGGVLHSTRSLGVAFQSLANLRANGWKILSKWRPICQH